MAVNFGNGVKVMAEIEGFNGKLKATGRTQLQDVILQKVVLAINSYSEIGHLKSKCLHLSELHNKYFQKLDVLQKQMTEMAKVLDKYKASSEEHPTNSQEIPRPLKFYRSVGLQVKMESFGGPQPSQVARMTHTGRMDEVLATSNTFTLPTYPEPTTNRPSQPELMLLQERNGIVELSWNHIIETYHAKIASYQIYCCQQPLVSLPGLNAPPEWKLLGYVAPLDLPMLCALRLPQGNFTDDIDEIRYSFIIRALDVQDRSGPFSNAESIVVPNQQQQ